MNLSYIRDFSAVLATVPSPLAASGALLIWHLEKGFLFHIRSCNPLRASSLLIGKKLKATVSGKQVFGLNKDLYSKAGAHHGTQVMLSPSATHCIALHSYAAGIALFQSQIASRRDVYVLSTQTTPSSSPPFQTGIKFARYPWTAQASGVVKIPSVSVRPL